MKSKGREMKKDAKGKSPASLSRRERQIMDVVYKQGKVSVAEVMERLSNPPSYSAVRATMRILEEKGHLKHEKQGKCFIYLPTAPREKVKKSMLKHVLNTFFDGSVEQAVLALLEFKEEKLTDRDLKRLTQIIEDSKKGGETDDE